MKKLIIAIAFLGMAISSCKQNSQGSAGDSTGTGAAGARVPGQYTSDTTRHDTLSSLTDSSQSKKTDTAKKK